MNPEHTHALDRLAMALILFEAVFCTLGLQIYNEN